MLSLAIIGALFALARATRSSLVLWGFLWSLIIFISFYALGMDDPVVSEPRFYLPGLGIHLILAIGLVELGIRHPIAGWLRVGVPALLMILTFSRGQDYRSAIALWEETATASPHKARVHPGIAANHVYARQPRRRLQHSLPDETIVDGWDEHLEGSNSF